MTLIDGRVLPPFFRRKTGGRTILSGGVLPSNLSLWKDAVNWKIKWTLCMLS